MKILTLEILCFASVTLVDDFKAIDGKEYKNVTVSRVEPDGIVLITSSGISKVYFTELPKEVQERFHYDATKAAAYSAEQTAGQITFRNQQAELRRKLAEGKNKYWTGQGTAQKPGGYASGTCCGRRRSRPTSRSDLSRRAGGHRQTSRTRQRDRCRFLCGLVRPV